MPFQKGRLANASTAAKRIVFSPYFLFPLLSLLLAAACATQRQYVPQGGDPVDYLMAARYWPDFGSHIYKFWGWGYPAIVRLFSFVVHDEFVAGLAVSVLATPLVTLLTVGLAFRFLPPPYAWGMSAVAATHPLLIGHGSITMTEVLFAALVWSVIWLLFVREHSATAVVLSGVVAVFAWCVRGNAMIMILVVPILLVLEGTSGLRRAALFGLGAAFCYLSLLGLFFAVGAPPSRLLPHGADELAFAALDESGNWLHRAEYAQKYPNLTSVFFSKPWEMTRAAAKSVFHLYDWWLLPALGVLGFLTVPGFLVWLRRWQLTQMGLTGTVIALLLTSVWHAKFGTRHLVATFPFLLLLSFYGLFILPRRIRVGSKILLPLRGLVTVLVVIPTLLFSAAVLSRETASPYSQRVIDQNDAGLWLKTHAEPGDRLAASRETIAFCAHVLEIHHQLVFGTTPPAKEQIAGMLRAKNCRWFAWIKGHSEIELPDLAWLATEESFGDCELVFRNEHVSIWQVRDHGNTSSDGQIPSPRPLHDGELHY